MTVVGPYSQDDFIIMNLLKKHLKYMSKDTVRWQDMIEQKKEKLNTLLTREAS